MQVGIETKSAAHLSRDEMQAISKLFIRGGYLWEDFKKYRDYPESTVALARYGDKVIGWGLGYEGENKTVYQQLYIQKGYRGRGIGLDVRKALKRAFPGKREVVLGSRTMELAKK